MQKLMETLHKARYPDTGSGKKKSPRSTRKKPAPKWVRPTTKGGVVLAVAAIAIGGPTWLWQSGTISRGLDALWQQTVTQTAELGLKVDKVTLRGRHYATRRDVIRAVRLKRGDPLLGFNMDRLRDRLIKLPWVREAVIKRHWPDTVDIQITEREPMVLLQKKRRLYLMDIDGVTITSRGLGRFHNLLIIVGKGAPKATPTLLAMIASEPALARNVTSATLIGKRRWNLKFKSGIKVRLPEQDPHKAWQRLARLNAKHRLLARDVRMIDMRLPNRLLIRPGVLGSQTTRVKGQRT
ncbi:MAG: FtsQ-type POTRA domain-containing protein [Alphaproteobacteria bacterium]|nr:FtsQ-type POTRA domain-containing protein [Alphaproteobacteria bacterium]